MVEVARPSDYRLWPLKAWFHLWNWPLRGAQVAGAAMNRWAARVNCNNACRSIGSKARVR